MSFILIDQKSLLVKLLLWVRTFGCWKNIPRGRGRPLVYPWHAIFRGLLFMLIKHLRRIPALDRALRQSRRYRWLCGFYRRLPCQRTWYRRFQGLGQIVSGLKEQLLLKILKDKVIKIGAADATAIESYGRHASQKRHSKYKPGDCDATWGKTVTKGWFQGYKLHCLTSTRPLTVPLSWHLKEASSQEASCFDELINEAETEKRLPETITADKAYDSDKLFQEARGRGAFLAALLRNIRPPTKDSKKVTESREYRKSWSETLVAKKVFKRRSDIERCFSHLKETFLLDPSPVRHWANVRAYVHLCQLTYLAMVAFNKAYKRPLLKLQDIMCSF